MKSQGLGVKVRIRVRWRGIDRGYQSSILRFPPRKIQPISPPFLPQPCPGLRPLRPTPRPWPSSAVRRRSRLPSLPFTRWYPPMVSRDLSAASTQRSPPPRCERPRVLPHTRNTRSPNLGFFALIILRTLISPLPKSSEGCLRPASNIFFVIELPHPPIDHFFWILAKSSQSAISRQSATFFVRRSLDPPPPRDRQRRP